MNNYRPKYHFTVKEGWINDPNGFVFFKGYYHLFYQYQLNGSPMSWGHAISKDLIHFEELPLVICHEHYYDKDGSWSGSSIVFNDKLYLIYTGHRIYKEKPLQTQNILISDDGFNFTYYDKNPVIGKSKVPENCSIEDFRDPSLFIYKDKIYCLIGNRSKDDKSQLLLYKSKDMLHWKYERILISTNELGYMIECPSSFHENNKRILIMSPIGIKPQGNDYWNRQSSVYLVCKENLKNIVANNFYEIDNGLDFYAAHVIASGNIMLSWMQNWGRTIPSIDEGIPWVNCFTLPRTLSLQKDKLIQKPVDSINECFGNELSFEGKIKGNKKFDNIKGNVKYLHLELSKADDFSIKVFKKDDKYVNIYVKDNEVYVDRRNSLNPIKSFHEELASCNYRKVKIDGKKLTLDIYLDRITIEIFINDGIKTMSTISFNPDDYDDIEFESIKGQKVKIIAKDFNDKN